MIRSFAKVFGKTRRFPPRRRTAFVVFRGWTGPVGPPPVGPGPVSGRFWLVLSVPFLETDFAISNRALWPHVSASRLPVLGLRGFVLGPPWAVFAWGAHVLVRTSSCPSPVTS